MQIKIQKKQRARRCSLITIFRNHYRFVKRFSECSDFLDLLLEIIRRHLCCIILLVVNKNIATEFKYFFHEEESFKSH